MGVRRYRVKRQPHLAKLGGYVAVYVLAASGVAWGVFSLNKHLMTSPKFQVTKIEINGGHESTRISVADQVQPFLGVNVFRCDLLAVKVAASKHPLVGDVVVSREIPDRLRIFVKEKQAEGLVRVGSHLYAVDGAGQVLVEANELPQQLDVPIIKGAHGEIGSVSFAADINRGLVALSQIREANLLFWGNMEWLDVSDSSNLVAGLSYLDAPVYLGPTPKSENLEHFLLIAQHVGERYPELAYVELGYAGQVSVMPRSDGR
ncbi:MAG: FtsQ-type POTRA domain-containing protein [Acidobacteria bacterium]|nr:FtsQ-type POTRA domain-containing protein [Acidobacteriota bacterium]